MHDEVIIKRELSGHWHWLVRGADFHIYNRSDVGFDSKDTCIADAQQHGLTIATVVG